MVFCQVLLLSPSFVYCRNCKRLREFEEIEISAQGKAEEGTLKSKE
jgi:hypothetical protein